ncbi:MAG: hypothetical protein Q4G26_14775 [Paracoccus sp. (in: a-proteobacteria)]|nr:hypothetical protein [Paracoccus sp. (in: a-proteobacteria)]
MQGITAAFAAMAMLFIMVHAAFGQAFGVEMGTRLADLSVQKDLGQGRHEIQVPQPHPEFESYIAQATDETGVCLVRGIGKSHDNDRFGIAVRGAFAGLNRVLQDRYGESAQGDFLRPGALWRDSGEWVMAVRQNERVHQAVWKRDYGADLPETLNEIILSVMATSSDSAWIALQYRFANVADCEAIIDKVASSGL